MSPIPNFEVMFTFALFSSLPGGTNTVCTTTTSLRGSQEQLCSCETPRVRCTLSTRQRGCVSVPTVNDETKDAEDTADHQRRGPGGVEHAAQKSVRPQ